MKLFEKILKEDEGATSDFVNGVAGITRYADPNSEFPVMKVKEDDGVSPEWFYDVFTSYKVDSERSAIHQYITNASQFEEYNTLALGIGITEMVHLDKLSDAIKDLGGRLDKGWNTSGVKFANTIEEAVDNDIAGEKGAIAGYQKLLKRLEPVKTNTGLSCYKLIDKILKDEEYHVKLLENFKKKLKD